MSGDVRDCAIETMSNSEIVEVFEVLHLDTDEARQALLFEAIQPRKTSQVQIVVADNTSPHFPPTQCPPLTTS